MVEINVPTANPSNTQSGEVPSIPSRTRPATAPPTIGITMIAVTWARILTSPSGVSCVIRVRLTAVGRAGVYRRPPDRAVRPLLRRLRSSRAASGRASRPVAHLVRSRISSGRASRGRFPGIALVWGALVPTWNRSSPTALVASISRETAPFVAGFTLGNGARAVPQPANARGGSVWRDPAWSEPRPGVTLVWGRIRHHAEPQLANRSPGEH